MNEAELALFSNAREEEYKKDIKKYKNLGKLELAGVTGSMAGLASGVASSYAKNPKLARGLGIAGVGLGVTSIPTAIASDVAQKKIYNKYHPNNKVKVWRNPTTITEEELGELQRMGQWNKKITKKLKKDK